MKNQVKNQVYGCSGGCHQVDIGYYQVDVRVDVQVDVQVGVFWCKVNNQVRNQVDM